MEPVNRVAKDKLFVGLTRVPTVAGIPYAAFIVEVIFASMANIATGNPLYLLLAVPVHAVLYLISSHDPGIFAEIAVWLKTNGRTRNKVFWDASSVSPLVTRKWKP